MSIAPDASREAAYKRIKERRDFWPHLIVYLLINGLLIAVWAVWTPGVIFWPVFPLGGWGIGLLMHAYAVFVARPISDADIQREVDRVSSKGGGTRAA